MQLLLFCGGIVRLRRPRHCCGCGCCGCPRRYHCGDHHSCRCPTFWGNGRFCLEPGLCIFYGNAFHFCCSTYAFNSVLVADMSMVMFLTGQSGFITLGILSYLVLCFDLSVLVVQRLFNGCSGLQRAGMAFLYWCASWRTTVHGAHTIADGRKAKTDWLVASDESVHFQPALLLDFQKRHIIPHATYRFSSQ